MSQYDDLAQLLAFYESSAELIRMQIRTLWRGTDGRPPQRSLVATVRAASAQHVRARAADRRQAHRPAGTSHAVIDRRTRTANELEQFDPHQPKRPADLPVPVVSLGSLVRRGYLRRQGAGYIRTAKPFHVDPSAEGRRDARS